METIKNAIGLGTAPQEGREPVSGVSGAGTASEPYDQGNVDATTLGGKAPQQTDPSTDYSTSSSDPSQDRSTTNALSSVSGGVAPNAASATPTTDSNPSTEAAAAVGTSSSGNPTDPMHAHQDIPSDPATGGIGRGSGPPSHALAGSKGSIAPELPDHSNAPLKPAAKGGDHGINPDAIPTAGGKKLGEDSFTERKSISVEGGSASGGLPTETSANTARNMGTAAPAVGGAGAEDVSSTSGSGAGLDKESSPSTSSSGHKKKPSLVEKIKDKVHKH